MSASQAKVGCLGVVAVVAWTMVGFTVVLTGWGLPTVATPRRCRSSTA